MYLFGWTLPTLLKLLTLSHAVFAVKKTVLLNIKMPEMYRIF